MKYSTQTSVVHGKTRARHVQKKSRLRKLGNFLPLERSVRTVDSSLYANNDHVRHAESGGWINRRFLKYREGEIRPAVRMVTEN